MGLLVLLSLVHPSFSEPLNSGWVLPQTTCQDLVAVWTYGVDIAPLIAQIQPLSITVSSTPLFPILPQSLVVCHATRIQNGKREELFIRIGW